MNSSISHTLMLETDVRNLSYCALLVLATDVSTDELYTAGARYDIEDTIDALISFIETKGEDEQEGIRLPEWSEMKSLTAQYGVTV